MIWDFTATDFMRQGRGDYTSKNASAPQIHLYVQDLRGFQNQNKNAKLAIALTLH